MYSRCNVDVFLLVDLLSVSLYSVVTQLYLYLYTRHTRTSIYCQLSLPCRCACSCVYVDMCVCVCVRERERERERERGGGGGGRGGRKIEIESVCEGNRECDLCVCVQSPYKCVPLCIVEMVCCFVMCQLPLSDGNTSRWVTGCKASGV